MSPCRVRNLMILRIRIHFQVPGGEGYIINLSYDAVDLGSVYGIYNKATDKMTVHVPLGIGLDTLNNNNEAFHYFGVDTASCCSCDPLSLNFSI